MRCTVVLEFDDGDSTALRRVELTRLYRDVADPKPGDVGLFLAEGKTLLQTVQQEFAMAQIQQFCELRRTCRACGAPRRRHDSHCSELKTTLGKVFYCRERWKACDCGADESRYVSPLKNYLPESSTGELRWLHATLGASMPYRQAMRVMQLLLPTSGRDNHVTLRNHTVSVGGSIQDTSPPRCPPEAAKAEAELGIDVGYVRQVKGVAKGKDRGKDSSSIAIVVAAVGPVGKPPRVWASALPRSKRLHIEMSKFLKDSGYEPSNRVCVLSDGARDLAAVATALPHASRWVLDWAHIGRMLQYVDQAIAPLAHGRLTPAGSTFELWDLFVRFRSWVWTGETKRWKVAGEKLCELLALREQGDPTALRKRAQAARYKLMDLLYYLQANLRSLIDYRSWQLAGRRISTGFVESTINRIVGRRMCKGQQMRWSRLGAHCLVQVRAALLNQELDEIAHCQFPWLGEQRISWPWQQTSHSF